MTVSLQVLSCFAVLVGGVEWWLAIRRTVAVLKRERLVIGLTVFLETFLAFTVAYVSIRELPTLDSFIVYGFYCLGGALGSMLPMRSRV